MISTNSTPLLNACQQKKPLSKPKNSSLKQFLDEPLFCPLSKEEFVEKIISLHPTKKKGIDQLFWYTNNFKVVCPSQRTLGSIIDKGREQSNKIISVFKELSFVKVYRRGLNNTAVYKLATIFEDPQIWYLLQDHIPNFKKLVLGLVLFQQILSPATQVKNMAWKDKARSQSKEFTYTNRSNYIYNNKGQRGYEESHQQFIPPPESPACSLLIQQERLRDLDQERINPILIERDADCAANLLAFLDSKIDKEVEKQLNERLQKEGQKERI